MSVRLKSLLTEKSPRIFSPETIVQSIAVLFVTLVTSPCVKLLRYFAS